MDGKIPISNSHDAANQFVGNKLSTKADCLQDIIVLLWLITRPSNSSHFNLPGELKLTNEYHLVLISQ